MKPRKRQPALADIESSLGFLNDDIAKHSRWRVDAVSTLAAAIEAHQATQGRRYELRVNALAAGDEEARAAYAQATVDARHAADQVDEYTALIGQIDAQLERLERDRTAAVQAEARAKVDALADTAIAAAAEADEALATLVERLNQLEAIRADQHRLRATAGLPEAENVKLQLNDHLGHVLTWRLYPRVGRPHHHVYQSMSLAEAESARQGRTPIVEPIDEDENAARHELIDAALTAVADDLVRPPPHTEH